MKVNGQDAEPGCYIAGHHDQYALDELGSVAEQFGIELDDDDDPRYWRTAAEAETAEDAVIISNGPNRIGNHLATPDECMERQVWAADKVEELLNDKTEGGYWTWQDGEFFLVYSGPLVCDECGRVGSEDDYAFLGEDCPDEDCTGTCQVWEPEQWTPNEIARGLDN